MKKPISSLASFVRNNPSVERVLSQTSSWAKHAMDGARGALKREDVARGDDAMSPGVSRERWLGFIRVGSGELKSGTVAEVNEFEGIVAGGTLRSCNLFRGELRDGELSRINVIRGNLWGGQVEDVNIVRGNVYGGEIRNVNVIYGSVHGGDLRNVQVVVGDIYGGHVDATLVVGTIHGGDVKATKHFGARIANGSETSERDGRAN